MLKFVRKRVHGLAQEGSCVIVVCQFKEAVFNSPGNAVLLLTQMLSGSKEF